MDLLKKYISEETPPRASAMINTFRAFGYNLQTAIADIVDNSISAKASNVWIDYEWNGCNSWVSIEDDGVGMDTRTLVEAMTPGSKNPNDEREIGDLGRFGLGLKTSSFSQCKALTVITKRENYSVLKRSWDLDYVNETGKWNLLDYISDNSFLDRMTEKSSGTIVLWEKLDRLVGNANKENVTSQRVYLEEFDLVSDHLGMVFHRYIEKKKLKIWINGIEIKAWDPFMKGEGGVQLLCNENIQGGDVSMKCYVLPHISMMSTESRKIAKTEDWYKLQGFYIYRNERLLLHGDWLGLFTKNEHYKNARILIDIPNTLDHEWKIDIKKATATPSISVRKDLKRLGLMTRMAAADIYRYRGRQIMHDDSVKSFDFQPIWKVLSHRDESIDYSININHPILKRYLSNDSVDKVDLKIILKLVANTIPLELIIQQYSENSAMMELRDENIELEVGVISVAKQMFESLCKSGISREIALKQIFNIEPFNKYPQLIEYI